MVVVMVATFMCGRAYASCIQQGSSTLSPSKLSSVSGYNDTGEVPSRKTVLMLAQSMSPLSEPLGPPKAVRSCAGGIWV